MVRAVAKRDFRDQSHEWRRILVVVIAMEAVVVVTHLGFFYSSEPLLRQLGGSLMES